MKALAAGRRHRLAPVVLMMLALLFTGAVYAAFAPSAAQADTASANDLAEGERLFITNCSTCHGLDAEGMDTAPSLVGVGAASVHFQIVTGRMPMDANSPQAEAKPPQLDEEQARQVAAYIASLGPGPSIPSDEQVDPALGDAAVGGQLFRTNCAMCHNAVGAGGALTEGKYAPALYESTPTEIYEAMLTGPQSMPVFNDATLTQEDKRDIIAYLVEQREPNPGGFSLGSLGPVSEGLWVFVVGMGVLIGAAVWIGARSS
ncbi:c-type cytochrome [Ruania alba]|uniref:Cytochrome bc1 complex cytochrome c subunit n=1 Tax=Ruania alba TaxID=648782 RepID=A0A1H5FGY0_9MICO|nr:c-type cytochrome [Ruania alba]SEE02394.1 menaquinol-cytochrome c reductase cytochrome c1 subunit precursor [Ruania alba]